MIFYKFFPGDYQSDTNRLTWEQDLAYRRLLDDYYSLEEGLPLDRKQCYLIARCVTPKQRHAVDFVLKRFFYVNDDAYRNHKADQVIEDAGTYRESQSAKGKKGGRPKKSPGLTPAKPTKSPSVAPVKPATSQTPEATRKTQEPSRSVVKENKEKVSSPPTDRPTKPSYRPTLKDARELQDIMLRATGKAETDQTTIAWLRATKSAEGFHQVKQVIELKLSKHKPNSNAWFKTVLQDQFGVSPADAEDARKNYVERYRNAISLSDPKERSAAAQACFEEAAEAGISILNSI